MGRKPTAIEIKKNRFDIVLQARKLSIQRLADATNHTRQGISKCLNSGRMDPQILTDVSKYLNISPDFFTGKEALIKVKEEKWSDYWDTYGNDNMHTVISGYVIPTFDRYLVGQAINEAGPLSETGRGVRYIRQAFIDFGCDPEFLEENWGYLVAETYRFMLAQIESVFTKDESYREYLENEEKRKQQAETYINEQIEKYRSMVDVIEPAEDPDS